MTSYLLVSLLAIVLTLLLRRVIRVSALLVLVTTLATAVTFQVLAYLHLGYLDPFFLIALLFSSVLAGAISTLTVMLLNRIRSRKDLQNQQP